MLPKKIIFFGLLIIGGLFFFLKGKSLHVLQSDTVRKEMELKEKKKALRAQGITDTSKMDLDKITTTGEVKKDPNDPRKMGNKYIAGECITNKADGWEFTKVLSVGPRVYKVIDCHKYKGCSEATEVSWAQIEFEYHRGRVIECSR